MERYFIATSSLSTYWISMYKSGSLYYWVDGTFIGGLIPKKGNPYVHVSDFVAGAAVHVVCAW